MTMLDVVIFCVDSRLGLNKRESHRVLCRSSYKNNNLHTRTEPTFNTIISRDRYNLYNCTTFAQLFTSAGIRRIL